MKLYTGVVENRFDPLKLGRCQVRVVGLHTEQKALLPTSDLPWAYPMQPITSAAMNGIGVAPVGPVEGTWVIVVFRDEDLQQPIILGTVGGIPQNESKKIDEFTDFLELFPSSISETGTKENDKEQIVVTDGSGNPIVTGDGITVTTATPAGDVASTTGATKKDGSLIPGNPPYTSKPGFSVSIPQSSYKGIQALGRAMTEMGFTSAYARAAILGIAMGESKCVPQNEAYNYSIRRLKQVYSWITDEKAEEYANWKGTRDDFFRYIYGPTTRSGKALGNKDADDGAKYWGRGYIQLTGKSNYERYKNLSGIDIISNPDLVNDYEIGAKICVAYFKDRVSVEQNDPSYFEAACRAVGYNTPDIKATKRSFYEYFLGEKVSTDRTISSQFEVNEQGIPKDRAKNLNTGFTDPDMKYPLRSHIGEPDTNRLARSKIAGTAVEKKDATRVTGVKRADGTTYSQPATPYNAKYPYNHIYQTESGHIQEFDDTPENERIHWYHKSGTFTEVDVNGSHVNRIIGDGYEIIDNNGYVYVRGALSLTSEGVTNIYVNADCNLKVEGITHLQMLNDVTWDIAGDLSVNVGGNTQLKSSSVSVEAASGEINMFSTASTNIQASSGINVKSATSTNIDSSGSTSVNSGGITSIDAGTKVNISNGTGENASSASRTSLGSAPTTGSPKNNNFTQLETPNRSMEEESGYETPEDHATQEGKAATKSRDGSIVGEKSTPQNTKYEESIEVVANKIPPKGSNCNLIMGMIEFPKSMQLSPNVTLGMLIASPSHLLQNQMARGKMMSKQEIVCNLKGLAEQCIEQIMVAAGGPSNIKITSGYRMNGVVAQSSATSQHPAGQAFDFQLTGKINDARSHYDFINKISGLIPYDQLILEYRDPDTNGNNRNTRICWIHCSFTYTTNRKMAFTMLNDKTFKSNGFALIT